jgi:hypothetical protein
VYSITRRTAAREDLFALLAWSSALFRLSVWFAGTALRRGELTCLAAAADASSGGANIPSGPTPNRLRKNPAKDDLGEE